MEKWEVTQLVLAGVKICQNCCIRPVSKGYEIHCVDCLRAVCTTAGTCKHMKATTNGTIHYEDLLTKSND